MRQRGLASKISLAAALAAALVATPTVVTAQAVPADLTTMPAVPTDYQPKKTAWGDPDLRGTWPIDNIASLPMNRPASFGNRYWLTEEEMTARQAQMQRSAQAYDAEDKAGIIPVRLVNERTLGSAGGKYG
jgi:hypothetical protein